MIMFTTLTLSFDTPTCRLVPSTYVGKRPGDAEHVPNHHEHFKLASDYRGKEPRTSTRQRLSIAHHSAMHHCDIYVPQPCNCEQLSVS